jgi:chromate transporter
MVLAPAERVHPTQRPPLASVARLAAWLGLIGFGGGYSVLAQLRRTVVERERWMTDREYADACAVAIGLPGANGANFFTLLGLRAGGVWGAALTSALFLLPSAALMVGLGAIYGELRNLRNIERLFAGMNPAVVAIVASVAFGLVKKEHRAWQLAVAGATLAAIELGVGVLEIVVLAVLVALLWQRTRPVLSLAPLWLILPKLAITFLRVGASSVAGGLAMIPILDHEVVGELHWLTRGEFSDAVTLGQITPGPVAITATFIGFRVAGLAGALVATLATFAPPFVANVIAGRSLEALRESRTMTALLAALGPITVGIVAAAALSLGRATLHGPIDAVVAAAAFVAVGFLRVPPIAALVMAAAARVIVS